MGNKVDMAEVIAFSDELKSATSKIKSQLNAIKKSANQIAAMDSFTGLTADSAKDYLKDFHIKITENFTTLFESLSTQLSSHIVSFQSEVDSSNIAFLDSDFLKDEKTKLSDQYSKVSESHSNLKATIQKISDISSLKPPSLSEAATDKKTAVQILQKTEDKLHNFTTKGKKDAAKMDGLLDQLEAILKDVGKMDKGNRFSEYYNGSANQVAVMMKNLNENFDKIKTVTIGYIKNRPLIEAAKKAGLQVKVTRVRGKRYYTIRVTREALRILGIEPDEVAEKQLRYRLPEKREFTAKDIHRANTNTAVLKYNAKHKNSLVWSKTGEAAVKKYEALNYVIGEIDLKNSIDVKQFLKTVGNAAVKGVKNSLKDSVDVVSVAKKGGFGKSLGIVGAGLSYYSNYHDATDDGLNKKKAAVRATADTVIDTAVGGAVQAGLVASFQMLIPIPGVGAAVGFGVGVLANIGLNQRSKDKYGREKKDSYMDKLKSWYH